MWPGVLVAALLFQAAPSQDWQAEGLRALEQKNYPAAIAALEKAVTADPKSYAVHFNLALAYSLAEKDTEAIAEYRKTLELEPKLYEANLNLGILLLRNNQPESAIPVLRAAIEAKPKETRPAAYLGDALLAAGKLDEARPIYESVLAADPKSAAAELGLARVLARTGALNEAAPHFDRAVAMEPGYSEALLELAELYEARKLNAQAAAIYAKFPENAAARERAGEILLAEGKAAEALPHLEFAAVRSPTSANRLALATAYFATKQTEKGLKVLTEALAADPKNHDLRLLAGRVLRDLGRYPDAANQFLAAASVRPDSIRAWEELTSTCIKMAEDLGEQRLKQKRPGDKSAEVVSPAEVGSYRQALTALDRIKALGGEAPFHFYLRAIILEKLLQFQAALDNYKAFLAASGGKLPQLEMNSRDGIRRIQKELSKR